MNTNKNGPPILEIGEAEFEAEVLRSSQPVLVAFWTPWSRPCQILAAALDEVATACTAKVKIVKVNADDNPDLSLSYEVYSIPILLYFVDGGLRARVVGTASKEAILSKLQTVLHGGGSTAPTPNTKKKDADGNL